MRLRNILLKFLREHLLFDHVLVLLNDRSLFLFLMDFLRDRYHLGLLRHSNLLDLLVVHLASFLRTTSIALCINNPEPLALIDIFKELLLSVDESDDSLVLWLQRIPHFHLKPRLKVLAVLGSVLLNFALQLLLVQLWIFKH